MTKEREYLIDREELEKRISREMRLRYLSYDSRDKWNEEDNRIYRNIRSNVYNQLRKEAKGRKAKFWDDMTAGNLTKIMHRFGLVWERGGKITFAGAAKPVLKWFLEQHVIPTIKNELKLDGISITKNYGPYADNVLNFEKAFIIKETKNSDEDVNTL